MKAQDADIASSPKDRLPMNENIVDTVSPPLGVQLKTYFDRMTEGPAPDRLVRLAEQLDAAFERGELRCVGSRRR
jgi:hypothetical protein